MRPLNSRSLRLSAASTGFVMAGWRWSPDRDVQDEIRQSVVENQPSLADFWRDASGLERNTRVAETYTERRLGYVRCDDARRLRSAGPATDHRRIGKPWQ